MEYGEIEIISGEHKYANIVNIGENIKQIYLEGRN